MPQNILLCFSAIILTIIAVSASDLSDDNINNLLARLRTQSKNILNEKIQSKEDLKNLQVNILKRRNFQCMSHDELNNFGKTDLDRTWENELASFNDEMLRKTLDQKVKINSLC